MLFYLITYAQCVDEKKSTLTVFTKQLLVLKKCTLQRLRARINVLRRRRLHGFGEDYLFDGKK